MGSTYASGRIAIAECDRCGQRFKLKALKTEVVKTKRYELKVCPECWDPDHPQLLLGMYPVEDPQALRSPRRDTTYVTAGVNGLQLTQDGFGGYPTGGSRDIQWGWYPVGGARDFDNALTPNSLVATTSVGTVEVNPT